ncbi:hypothetical protein VTO73DRAFT_6483 [Trametes versicolor]
MQSVKWKNSNDLLPPALSIEAVRAVRNGRASSPSPDPSVILRPSRLWEATHRPTEACVPNDLENFPHDEAAAHEDSSADHSSVIDFFPSEKIKRLCKIAAEHNYDYAWADLCCTDQTSSSELSEAINSMYDWYRYAGVCYVFLYDVPTPATSSKLEAPESPFRKSRWHKRGWTLQELLAPTVVVFLSCDWRIMGTKHSLAHLIHAITGIDTCILTGERALEDFSVACRMSWASSRETKRVEDEAYSLMGIFGVNMPTTYGEGRYAFIRLQEEILKHHSDQTIFAWGPVLSNHNFSFHHPHTYRAESDLLAKFQMETSSQHQFLLASSPKDFRYSSNLISIPWDEFMRLLGAPLEDRPTYTMTSYGVRTRLPLLAVRAKNPQTNVPTCIALLACKDADGNLTTLLLRSQPKRPEKDYFVGAVVGQLRDIMGSFDNIEPYSMTPAFPHYYFRTAFLSPEELNACSMRFHSEDIYIPYRPSLASYSLQRDVPMHSNLRSISSNDFDLRVSSWSHELLRMHGYSITHQPGRNPFTIDIANTTDSETISIYVGRCDCQFGDHERFLSVDVCLNRPDRATQVTRPAPHKRNHDGHIQSWKFRNGAASKEFCLRSATDKRTTVRLSLTKATESHHSESYMLGVELWKTRGADVERERERIKSKVTGKAQKAPSSQDSGSRPRFLDSRRSAAPPLLRSRSSSYPPEPIPIEVSAPSPTESQQNNFLSPALTAAMHGGLSPLLTPPISRNTSMLNGAMLSPWGSDHGTDAESWYGIGYQPSEGSQTRMDVDVTPMLSPVDSQVSYATTHPVPPTHRRSDPSIPNPSRSMVRPPQKSSTLDVLRPTPSEGRPPFPADFRRMETELRPPERIPQDDVRRRNERRRSLPSQFYMPQAQSDLNVSLSVLTEEPLSFQGSPPPSEGSHQDPPVAASQPPTRDVRQDVGETSTPKRTAKRSRPEDESGRQVPQKRPRRRARFSTLPFIALDMAWKHTSGDGGATDMMGVAEIRRAPRSRTKLKTKRVGDLGNVEGNEGSHHALQVVGLDVRPSE